MWQQAREWHFGGRIDRRKMGREAAHHRQARGGPLDTDTLGQKRPGQGVVDSHRLGGRRLQVVDELGK